MRAVAPLACGVLAVLACSDLPPITPGVCGNGVVEGSEACDGSSADGTCGSADDPANACRFVCATPADAPAAGCPAGQACGIDHRCRAPSGRFARAPGPYLLPATELQSGDVDGDGIADLVGVGDIALTARYGDPSGDLAAIVTQPLRARTGQAAFGDLDGDGRLDVEVPTDVGLFTFRGGDRAFSPFLYSSVDLGSASRSLRLGVVQPALSPLESSIVEITGNQIGFSTLGGPVYCTDGTLAAPGADACSAAPDGSALLGDHLFVGHSGLVLGSGATDAVDDPTDELVTGVRGAHEVLLWSSTQRPDGIPEISPVETIHLPLTVPVPVGPGSATVPASAQLADDGEIVFGDFDGDGCADLAIPMAATQGGTAYDAVVIARGDSIAGVCTGLPQTREQDIVSTRLVGQVPAGATTSGVRLRAARDLDGDGTIDFIFDGLIIYGDVFTNPGCNCSQATPRTWSRAVTGDFNDDGRVDLAGIVAGQPGIDVLLATPVSPAFDTFVVGTDLPVRAFALGDFDGDFADDLAAVIGDPTQRVETDEVVVTYGQATGGPTPVIAMGAVGSADPPVALNAQVDLARVDLATDLLVSSAIGSDRRAALMLGDGSRRLFGPFLFSDPEKVPGNDVVRGAVIGQFDADPHVDVATVVQFVPRTGSVGTSGSGAGAPQVPRLFVLSGQGDGDLVASPGDERDLGSFEYTNAIYATVRLGSDHDSVAGIDEADGQPHLAPPIIVVADPPTGSASAWSASRLVMLRGTPYEGLSAHALRAADLDGDGQSDLVVEMRDGSAGAIEPFVAWDADTVEPIAPHGVCQAFWPIDLDGAGAHALAASCTLATGDDALGLFTHAGSAWTEVDLPVAIGGGGQLVTGDFNGDHLIDVAMQSGSGDLQVYLQCARADACADALGGSGGAP